MIADLAERAFATGVVRDVTCDGGDVRCLLDGAGDSIEVYLRPNCRFAHANGAEGPLTIGQGAANLRTERGTTRRSVTGMT